ncbi:MAG: DUF2806 domain-containing protein [Verrucomicrobiota bacterium]|jgi:hypothetical protein
MSKPIVDLAPLSKPVSKLVEVVAQGIGAIYKPIGTVLQAKADAKAKLVIAEADIEVSQLWRRAAERLLYTEIERQKNLEAIVHKARIALPERVRDDPVPKDWIMHFFTAAQDVSDEDMQMIWGRILAGEVAEPGATSGRTLQFLKTISKQEAEVFTTLLSVSFADEGGWRFVVEDPVTSKTIAEASGGADVESHMRDIGILGAEPLLMDASKTSSHRFSYGGVGYKFIGPAPPPRITELDLTPLELSLAIRRFSAVGQELSKVARQEVRKDFIPLLSASLQKQIKVRIDEDKGEQAAAPNDGPATLPGNS